MELALPEIDSLDVLVEALAAFERAQAKIAVAAVQLALSGTWQADGTTSMGSWLANHARLSHRDAARLLRDGRFLARFEAVADAAMSGRLSAGQVAALRAAVSGPTAELFGEHQHGVVDAIAAMNVADSETVCQQWRQRAEAVVEMPEPKIPDQSWKTSRLEDGTVVGRFVLGPAGAAQLEQAIGTASRWAGANDERQADVRHADAATDVFAFFNANHNRAGTPRHRPHVEMHIETGPSSAAGASGASDASGGMGCAVTADGQLIPSWATDAFLCDCVIHRVLRAGATILDYGRSTRSVPANLYRAVIARDRGCRWRDCNRKVAWCDAHHIQHWRRHGETKLDNLLMLCGHHHRMVHRDNWKITLHADSTVVFTAPDGRTLTSRPHAPPILGPPIIGPPIAA